MDQLTVHGLFAYWMVREYNWRCLISPTVWPRMTFTSLQVSLMSKLTLRVNLHKNLLDHTSFRVECWLYCKIFYREPAAGTVEAAVAKQRQMMSPICQKYADVSEPGREHVVCGTEQRDKVVYTSVGQEVTVKVDRSMSPKKSGVFLLHFQGKSAFQTCNF